MKPISEAPKDGTHILAYCPGVFTRTSVVEAWWGSAYGAAFWQTDHDRWDDGDAKRIVGWFPMPDLPEHKSGQSRPSCAPKTTDTDLQRPTSPS